MKLHNILTILLVAGAIIIQYSCNGLVARHKNREFPKEETVVEVKDYSHLFGMHRGSIDYNGKMTDAILTLKDEGVASITLKIQGNLFKKVGKYEINDDILTLRTSDKDEFHFEVSSNSVSYKNENVNSSFKLLDPNSFDKI